MPQPIQYSAEHIDLGPRYFYSTTVAASPAGSSETTIATLTVLGDLSMSKGIRLSGWAAFTVGTSGANVNLKIRQTNTSGTTIAATGALTGGIAAGNLVAQDVDGFDAAGVLPGQVYVLTLTVGSGAAASNVSAVLLDAIVI